MIPNKFRYKIDVYGKVKGKNELNQTSYIDDKIITVWAEVIPQTGNMQRQQVETMLTHVTHKIICRYNQTIYDAYQQQQNKSDMHIMFKGQRFNIKYILNPYFRNETLEIFAEEVVG
jgi:SPP1 family predicted phage head-tail adaptor